MASKAKKAQEPPSLAANALIIDNGAYNIKAGFASASPTSDNCKTIPNCVARSREKKVYVGSQLSQCDDFAEMLFRRPLDNGFILHWTEERAIWENSFLDANADVPCDPAETNLILTEAPNCPQNLQVQTDQMVFEEFEFASCYRTIGPSLNAYNDVAQLFDSSATSADIASNGTSDITPAECLLVIDSGYSHTTVTPLLHGRPVQQAIRRLPLGGKLLTNAYKELISTQHTSLWDDTVPTTELKEANSYISQDYRTDMDRTWKVGAKQGRRDFDYSMVVDWVLPDYEGTKMGYGMPHEIKTPGSLKARTLATHEPVIPLASERFQVPELLFSPTDVGLPSGGIVDVTLETLSQIPEALRPAFTANILLVGGNMNIKGLKERVERDLRGQTPEEWPVKVVVHPEPDKATWLGGARLGSDQELLSRLVVTKQEYAEYGHTMGGAWAGRQYLARANATAAEWVHG